MIFVWNDHRDQGLSLDLQSASVPSGPFCHLHLCRDSHSLIMLFHGFSSCFKSIGLAFRICCRGIHMTAPVIQNPGNMDDLLCLFTAAENKIKILGSVKFFPEISRQLCHLSLYHKNMADIIIIPETEQVEIRFKMRIKIMLSVHADLVLICVYYICILIVNGLYDLKQRVRLQSIVMVAEHQVFSSGKLHGLIGVHRNPAVGFQLFIADPYLMSVIFFQKLVNCLVRTSVCQTKLPVSIGLFSYGLNQLLQIGKGRTVKRDHNTDQRLSVKRSMLLLPCLTPAQRMTFQPLFRISLSVFPTVQKPVKKSLWPLLFTKLLNIYLISLFHRRSCKFKQKLLS